MNGDGTLVVPIAVPTPERTQFNRIPEYSRRLGPVYVSTTKVGS